MGHYNYHATKFKIKKDTPPEVMAVLDSLFLGQSFYEEFIKDPANDVLIDRNSPDYKYDEFWSFFQGNSNGDPCNAWQVKEDKEDHWLFESRANCKFKEGQDLVINVFFSKLLPWLIIEEGDILHRRIYESASQEIIHCVEDGKITANYELGCRYSVEYDFVIDDRHPYRHEDLPNIDRNSSSYGRSNENPSNWTPPWTLKELLPINQKFEEELKNNKNHSW